MWRYAALLLGGVSALAAQTIRDVTLDPRQAVDLPLSREITTVTFPGAITAVATPGAVVASDATGSFHSSWRVVQRCSPAAISSSCMCGAYGSGRRFRSRSIRSTTTGRVPRAGRGPLPRLPGRSAGLRRLVRFPVLQLPQCVCRADAAAARRRPGGGLRTPLRRRPPPHRGGHDPPCARGADAGRGRQGRTPDSTRYRDPTTTFIKPPGRIFGTRASPSWKMERRASSPTGVDTRRRRRWSR